MEFCIDTMVPMSSLEVDGIGETDEDVHVLTDADVDVAEDDQVTCLSVVLLAVFQYLVLDTVLQHPCAEYVRIIAAGSDHHCESQQINYLGFLLRS